MTAATYLEALAARPGARHIYDLGHGPEDYLGGVHGRTVGPVTYDPATGAHFPGEAYVDFGDHPDFSVATRKALSLVWQMSTTWEGSGPDADEYVHPFGKGSGNQMEYSARYYVKGSKAGEAPQRQGRTSWYHWNLSGGLGAGSYFQDSTLPTRERHFVVTCDMRTITLYVDGVKRDSDALSGYSIVPSNGTAPLRFGTRDLRSFLVGTGRNIGIFDRVLTAAEASGIYADSRTLPVYPPEPPTPPTPAPDEFHASGLDDVVDRHNALVDRLRSDGTL